jgi:hypothetical protein
MSLQVFWIVCAALRQETLELHLNDLRLNVCEVVSIIVVNVNKTFTSLLLPSVDTRKQIGPTRCAQHTARTRR